MACIDLCDIVEEDDIVIIDDDVDHEPRCRDRPEARQRLRQHHAQTKTAEGGQQHEELYGYVYVLDCGCQEAASELSQKLQQQCTDYLQQLLQQTTSASVLVQAVLGMCCSHCGCMLSNQDALKLLGPASMSGMYAALTSRLKQLALSQPPGAAGPTFAAPAGSSDAAAAANNALTATTLVWRELAALQSVMLGGGCDATATGRGGREKQHKAKKSKAVSVAWAAGTGYGGSGLNKQAQAAMSAAAARQAATDAALAQHLQALSSILGNPAAAAADAAATTADAGSSGRKRLREASAGSPSSLLSASGGLPWPVCAAVLAGPLAWLLRLLFQNDSLMDVVSRTDLYKAGMDLLRLIGASPDLLPLLQLPADDPRDTSNNAASAAAAASTSSSHQCTILSALRLLAQQAKLYARSAEQLIAYEDVGQGEGEGVEDTTAAIGLALDLGTLLQDLENAVQLFSNTMPAAGQLQLKLLSATLDAPLPPPPPPAAAVGHRASRRAGSRGGSSTAAAAAAPSPAAVAASPDPVAAAAAALQSRYVSAMQPYRFIEADLLAGGHYFAKTAAANSKSAGGEVMRRRLKRITEELGALSTSLPLSWDSSILLAVHVDRLDVLRALLLPHPETPYAGGAFVFDLLLPPEYPDKPPMVQFLTTGGGCWRANPNLYDCGKVCLSLLGTWSGPSWEPGVSTLLQVLVSLQSMVFVPDPYYNEPGYESRSSSAAGRQEAARYNSSIRLGTASHALLPALRSPDPVFEEALKVHYSFQGPRITKLLQEWVKDAHRDHTSRLQSVVQQIQQELAKLPQEDQTEQQQQRQQQPQEQQQGQRTWQWWQQSQPPHQQAAAANVAAEVDVVDLT